jgi:hypothetical protein
MPEPKDLFCLEALIKFHADATPKRTVLQVC